MAEGERHIDVEARVNMPGELDFEGGRRRFRGQRAIPWLGRERWTSQRAAMEMIDTQSESQAERAVSLVSTAL